MNKFLFNDSQSQGRTQLSGKTAIITGSSKGIGRVIARCLAEAGARIVLNGRSPGPLRATHEIMSEEGHIVTSFLGDVSRVDESQGLIDHAISKFGSIDILVNNAGVGSRGFFEDVKPEVFRKLISVNILGSLYPTQAAIPHLKKSKGSIVFISSLAGLRGLPNVSTYSMSKMAIKSIAESLRTELSKDKIHVGIVYSGKTKNDPSKKVLMADGSEVGLKPLKSVLVHSQEDVGKKVIQTLLRKKFMATIGIHGAAFYYLQRFLPLIVEFVTRTHLNHIRKLDT